MIWLDWEQDGACTRLYFKLGAVSGPGSGRMQDYFELGEAVSDAAPPVLPPPASEQTPPPRSPGSGVPRKHPAAETDLGERTVACDCPATFHRPVLIEFNGVNACLRCGTVTCTRTVGDDGRFTGDSWQTNLAVAIAPEVLEWLAQWPRVTVHRHASNRWPTYDYLSRLERIYLPADARCETTKELQTLEDQRRGRIRESDFPACRPPAELPSSLEGFAGFWGALQLTPTSDLALLMKYAYPRNPGSAIAVERLLCRPDSFDAMVGALRSSDPSWQGAGVAMARAAGPADPRLPGVLIDLLQGLSHDPMPEVSSRIVSCQRFEELLVVIADLKIDTAGMLTTLKNLQGQLARKDATLVGAIEIVLRELQGLPPP